jgi:hypothetical protein
VRYPEYKAAEEDHRRSLEAVSKEILKTLPPQQERK